MIRHALVALIVSIVVVLALANDPGGALPPGPARLELQANLLSTVLPVCKGSPCVQPPMSTVRTYALFNRPSYKHRIGTGVSDCLAVSKDWAACHIYVHLSRGLIVAESLVPTAATFVTFAISGGTGYYSNVGGTITVQPLGQNAYLLLGTLEAFS